VAGAELAIPLCTREDKWLTLSSVERTFYDHSERDFLRVLERIQALRSGQDDVHLSKSEREQKGRKCAALRQTNPKNPTLHPTTLSSINSRTTHPQFI
jgi:hypothetical protein